MAKNKVKLPDILKLDFSRYFKKIEGDKIVDDIGQTAVDYIRNSTRAGRQLINNRKRKKLKPLKASTIRYREYLAAIPGQTLLKKIFIVEQSQLTISGQLLDAIKYRKRKKLTLEIYVDDNIRKPYKTQKGDSKAKPRTNREVAKDVVKDRPFMQIDDQGVKKLSNELAAEIRRQLSKVRRRTRI